MRILITGIGGFIGSHIATRLVREGHEVVGIDNGFTATHNKIRGAKIIKGDVTIPEDIEKAGKCDVVVHTAGLLGTNEIAELGQIQLANNVNINGTVNVLDYCKEYKARHIFATKPNPLDWMNPYTITKMAAEHYCIMYAEEYGVETTALSLYWVYGKEQRQEPVNKFVPTFMKHALEGKPIPVWNDGKQIIDCCYIDDIVEFFVRAINNPIKGYIKIDVGTGIPVTVLEVVEKIIKLANSKSKPKFIGKRLGEPIGSALVANTSLGKRFFDFVPSISLDEGLKETLGYYKKIFR